MEKQNLRKKDLATSVLIGLFGVWTLWQATNMPMKGSWGGVMNVWYVSPALFPLFVGVMLVLLSLILAYNALREIGLSGAREVGAMLGTAFKISFWTAAANVRFMAILLVLFSYVFLLLPRVDFFLASVLFLLGFILLFYPQQHDLLLRFLAAYAMVMVVAGGLLLAVSEANPALADWGCLLLIPILASYGYRMLQVDPLLARKFWITLAVAIIGPLLIGITFKYLLLVPLPYEGVVVELLDKIRYGEF
jgi:hypothetical protein